MDQQKSENPLKEGLQTQTQEPVGEPEGKPKSKSKLLLLVIILVVVLAWGGVVVAVVLLNKDSNTEENALTNGQEEEKETEAGDLYEGWKTYTDEEHGFSFRYPGSWSYTSNEDVELSQLAYGEAYLEIAFEDASSNKPIIVYLASYYGDPDEWCKLKASENSESYEVKDFAELEDEAGNPSTCYLSGEESSHIVFMEIGVDSIVTFEGGVDNKGEFIKVIESFEDNSSQSADPYEGWETYESSEYKFSFKYNSSDAVTENVYGGDDLLTLASFYGENELTWFVEKANSRSLQEFVNYYTKDNPYIIETKDEYMVGSVTGTLVEFEGYISQLDADLAHIEFYMEGDGDYYHRIRLYGSDQNLSEEEKNLFLKILESVRISE